MHNARFRLMAGLAGATLCLFAVTAYGQNPTTTSPTATAGTDAQTSTAQPATQGTVTTPAPTTANPTDNATVTGTAVTTTTETTRTFPGGFWGIIAVVALVLIGLVALMRGRDRTVIRDTYTSTGSPSSRTMGTGTAVGDRTLNQRTASGTTETTTRSETTTRGNNDPNSRL